MRASPSSPRWHRIGLNLRLSAPLGAMAGLFLLSAIPGDPGEVPSGRLASALAWTPPAVQNSLHIPAFAVLAWSWFLALAPWFRRTVVLLAGTGLTVAYAGLDEWHQAFVPGRFSSATDWVADGIGAVLAAVLYARFGK